MTKHISLEDIQPGAEFYSVFCIGNPFMARGMDAWIEKDTVVCNSGVLTESPNGPSGHKFICADVSTSPDNQFSKILSRHRYSVSLRDRHVLGVVNDESKTYNFHRFFKEKADAESWINEIRTGVFLLKRDQDFYDSLMS